MVVARVLSSLQTCNLTAEWAYVSGTARADPTMLTVGHGSFQLFNSNEYSVLPKRKAADLHDFAAVDYVLYEALCRPARYSATMALRCCSIIQLLSVVNCWLAAAAPDLLIFQIHAP